MRCRDLHRQTREHCSDTRAPVSQRPNKTVIVDQPLTDSATISVRRSSDCDRLTNRRQIDELRWFSLDR